MAGNAAGPAWNRWRNTRVRERSERIRALGVLLMQHQQTLARSISTEMGKPLPQALAEVAKSATLCELFADKSEEWLQPEILEGDFAGSKISYQPIGTILAIMPWNFPVWQAVRATVPALAAGNTVLLKHAPNVLGSAALLENIFAEAGMGDGVFGNIVADIETTEQLIQSPRIAGVTLTGSGKAGRRVASLAGASLKKCVLELGGSDPYIIFGDADMEKAAAACMASRFNNSGQTCIAAKRWIVVQSRYDEFLESVEPQIRRLAVGHPMDEGTDVGPMARRDLRDALAHQVQRAIADGARCVVGGTVPQDKGWYYTPTLLTDVEAGSVAFEEELFGPVACVVKARDEEHAIQLANASEYGLGAALFTADTEKAMVLAEREIMSGSCCINDFLRSDPRLPFGGTKASGFGREMSRHGLMEFVNVKTILRK